jgi:hypothetical protein
MLAHSELFWTYRFDVTPVKLCSFIEFNFCGLQIGKLHSSQILPRDVDSFQPSSAVKRLWITPSELGKLSEVGGFNLQKIKDL